MSFIFFLSDRKVQRFILQALFAPLIYCLSGSFSAYAGASSDISQPEKPDPASFLEFISELDGKCQILSAGGKLMLVKNNHPDKNIRYRFKRIFSGKPQGGLVIGTLEADGKPVKLGCTRVDGRDQTWVIKKAHFTDQKTKHE